MNPEENQEKTTNEPEEDEIIKQAIEFESHGSVTKKIGPLIHKKKEFDSADHEMEKYRQKQKELAKLDNSVDKDKQHDAVVEDAQEHEVDEVIKQAHELESHGPVKKSGPIIHKKKEFDSADHEMEKYRQKQKELAKTAQQNKEEKSHEDVPEETAEQEEDEINKQAHLLETKGGVTKKSGPMTPKKKTPFDSADHELAKYRQKHDEHGNKEGENTTETSQHHDLPEDSKEQQEGEEEDNEDEIAKQAHLLEAKGEVPKKSGPMISKKKVPFDSGEFFKNQDLKKKQAHALQQSDKHPDQQKENPDEDPSHGETNNQ